MILKVKITPNSSINKIVGWEGDILKIRLNAVPEKGKANQALITFLHKTLQIPKQSIQLVRGETSRIKLLEIHGLSKEQIDELISS